MVTLSKGLRMEKEIDNFPGYTVDDEGRVFSNQRRYVTRNNEAGAKPRRMELKQGKFWTGYKKVTLIDSTGNHILNQFIVWSPILLYLTQKTNQWLTI